MNTTKFEGVNYINTFAKRISVMHELVKEVLSTSICAGNNIIDIGGGPGMGAKIIDELGIKVNLTNIEPSSTIYDVPQLSQVNYIPLQLSLQEALDVQMPYTADCLLMVSSAHEITLCYGNSSIENKKKFFADLDSFIHKNLKKNATIIIGFPNYKENASQQEIARQRSLTESLLGHSHPPDEFFTVEEFALAFGTQPTVFIQKPMDLTHKNPDDTILVANVAVFNVCRNV
jgi:hypothetical protein